jgi:hypothetical protein
MIRSVVGKVMWVGRATVFLVGLAVTLALVFGVATAALGADGDFFKLGQRNVAQTVSTLVKKGTGSALALQVGADQPPLTVNAAAGTARGLSADELDGKNSTELEPRAYAQVTTNGSLIDGTSKGINDVVTATPSGSDPLDPNDTDNLYCFDLEFDDPRAAVGSPFINNNATITTTTDALGACPEGYRDAAVRTRAANRTTGQDTPVSFSIAFM